MAIPSLPKALKNLAFGIKLFAEKWEARHDCAAGRLIANVSRQLGDATEAFQLLELLDDARGAKVPLAAVLDAHEPFLLGEIVQELHVFEEQAEKIGTAEGDAFAAVVSLLRSILLLDLPDEMVERLLQDLAERVSHWQKERKKTASLFSAAFTLKLIPGHRA